MQLIQQIYIFFNLIYKWNNIKVVNKRRKDKIGIIPNSHWRACTWIIISMMTRILPREATRNNSTKSKCLTRAITTICTSSKSNYRICIILQWKYSISSQWWCITTIFTKATLAWDWAKMNSTKTCMKFNKTISWCNKHSTSLPMSNWIVLFHSSSILHNPRSCFTPSPRPMIHRSSLFSSSLPVHTSK